MIFGRQILSKRSCIGKTKHIISVGIYFRILYFHIFLFVYFGGVDIVVVVLFVFFVYFPVVFMIKISKRIMIVMVNDK